MQKSSSARRDSGFDEDCSVEEERRFCDLTQGNKSSN